MKAGSGPISPQKHSDPALFTAAEQLEIRRKRGTLTKAPLPETILLCHQAQLLEYGLRGRRAKRLDGFHGELYALEESGGRFGLAGKFGVGAPVVAVLVEEWAAAGARRFISLGIAGSLSPELQAGDLIVCERALRDEGTSYHYLPPARFAEASPDIVQSLARALDSAGQAYTLGASWTTDAPYRETQAEAERYLREGIQTVEMEAAALFAVGHRLGLAVGAAFSIGDSLSEGRWLLEYDEKRTQEGLERLFEAARAALLD